jgi:hypothetical protein
MDPKKSLKAFEVSLNIYTEATKIIFKKGKKPRVLYLVMVQ